jgi:hypothetical protein
MALQLVSDSYNGETDPPVARYRNYLVRDSDGNVWRSTDPLRIDETFNYVTGNGQMPAENAYGWTTTTPPYELRNGYGSQLDDKYSAQGLFTDSNKEVFFWQQYSATGFVAPGLNLPGIVLPGYAANTIPLMILGPNAPALPTACRYFGTQMIRLRRDYVGFNGDVGPNATCAW